MTKSSKYTWNALFNNSNIIMRRMIALGLQADRILEGRSKGVVSERICKERLLKIVKGTELELQVQDVLDEWQRLPQKMPEFLRTQIHGISNVIPGDDVDILVLKKLTSDVGVILARALTEKDFCDKDQLKSMADIGLLYFEFIIEIMSWFERDLHKRLTKGELTKRLDEPLPESDILKLRQFELLAGIFGYAGICLVTYASKLIHKFPRKWCRICFRRTAPDGSKYCHVHDTRNENKNDFRFGEKIRSALLMHNQYVIKEWRQYKKCINEKEEREREFSDSLDSPWMNWKRDLIKLLNRSPSLAKRVSIEYLKSIDSWIETVKYLRARFDNGQEKSYDIEAVWCWLHMAKDWFEIEYMFHSSNGDRLKSSKLTDSKLPTATLIADQCEREPGIIKSEVARRINMKPSTVGQCVKKHKELQKYFD